jgi:3-deoxy-D-manno-octulosonic-acid transferase
MDFLYKAGIIAWSVLVRTAALFKPKAKQFIRGRKNWRKNLASKIETNARYIWVHCASLGEFEQGRPLIEEIKKSYPQYRILLTFFSPSGYEIRKNYGQADIVMYMPLDTPRNAKDFIRIARPHKAFFIKYEYWYFFISELKKQNIPLYIVSAIFRETQPFFKKNLQGRWYSKILQLPSHFFVQDEKSAQLLQSAGISHVTISGDTRFDRVTAIAKAAKEIPLVEKFSNGKPLLIAGSTWKPDEDLLAEYINSHQLKMVIAPHEVTPANLNQLEQLLKKPFIRFSKAAQANPEEYQVLIIDSVGMLSSLYRYGSISYIGGGFGAGIHNILEAAVFGLPVIFGPGYEKFREAVELKKEGAAFPVKNYEQMKEVLDEFLTDRLKLEHASAACTAFVAKNTGSTSLIITKVFNKC